MASKDNRITKLRKDIDALRKNSTGALASANKAVYDGIEHLAEHELAAIRTHYEEALASLKTLRKGGSPRELATTQLQLLQETIDRIFSNARESLAILDHTRREISTQIRQNLEGSQTIAQTAGERAERVAGQAVHNTRGEAKKRAADAVATARQAIDQAAPKPAQTPDDTSAATGAPAAATTDARAASATSPSQADHSPAPADTGQTPAGDTRTTQKDTPRKKTGKATGAKKTTAKTTAASQGEKPAAARKTTRKATANKKTAGSGTRGAASKKTSPPASDEAGPSPSSADTGASPPASGTGSGTRETDS